MLLYDPIMEILDNYNAGLIAFLGKEEYERVYQSLLEINAFLHGSEKKTCIRRIVYD